MKKTLFILLIMLFNTFLWAKTYHNRLAQIDNADAFVINSKFDVDEQQQESDIDTTYHYDVENPEWHECCFANDTFIDAYYTLSIAGNVMYDSIRLNNRFQTFLFLLDRNSYNLDTFFLMPSSHFGRGDNIIEVLSYTSDTLVKVDYWNYQMRYPSEVMLQKWNDYIGVLTDKYNGGNHFVQFQWYKNDSIIDGATLPYLHQPLEVGAEYYVELTDSVGNHARSCPLIAEHKTDSTKYPTVVASRYKIKVVLPDAAKIVVYDAHGKLVAEQQGFEGDNILPQNFARGLYLVAIYDENNIKPTMTKILVQ